MVAPGQSAHPLPTDTRTHVGAAKGNNAPILTHTVTQDGARARPTMAGVTVGGWGERETTVGRE